MARRLLPPRPAAPPKIERAEWVILALIIAVGAWLRLWELDLGYLNSHTTRDLYRSQLLLRGVEFPLLGSEMMYGGRVLGPLMYILCAIPLAIWHSPLSVPLFIALVNIGVLALVWHVARVNFGPGVALWAAAILAVFPLEISQIRFYWNPGFLPLFATLAFWGVLGVAARGRQWHLLTVGAAIALGMQLHFSAVELIASAAIILLIAQRGARWHVWLALVALLVVLFFPLIQHERLSEESNVGAIAASDFSQREGAARFRFNPNGGRNFLYHVALEMNERGEDLGFAHLETVPLLGPTWIGERKMEAAHWINTLGKVQIIFWLIGLITCVVKIVQHVRLPPMEAIDRAEAQARVIPFGALLVWQAVPVLFLSFFSFHGGPGEGSSIVPIRYHLATYPAPQITTAVGIMALANIGRFQVVQAFVFTIAGLLLAGHVVFDHLYLQVIGRSGRFIPYASPNFAPTMRTVLWARDVLLEEEGLDRLAWYERTHAQQFGDRYFGEVSLDWVITQDPRSVTNDPPDENLRWLLHSPFTGRVTHAGEIMAIENPEPALPEGATEVRRHTLGDTGFTIVAYRVEDPNAPIPDNEAMRNIYYPHMRYLGPGEELREAGE